MKTKPQFRGSIILLHDGGGDRSVTIASLPVLIDTLRAKGYTIVPVSKLMGNDDGTGHAAADDADNICALFQIRLHFRRSR